MPQQWLSFLVAVIALTVVPGPDMALVLRNSMRGGSRAAWWTGLGCCAGLLVHACASVVGLSALLAASSWAYTAVKYLGAAYLVWLGAMALWGSRRSADDSGGEIPTPTAAVSTASEPADIGAAFRQGVVSNVLNPKIALLFLTLLPQFISPGEPRVLTSALLALVFLGVALLWWRVFSLVVAGLSRALARGRVRLALERITGTVLLGLGVRVAFESG